MSYYEKSLTLGKHKYGKTCIAILLISSVLWGGLNYASENINDPLIQIDEKTFAELTNKYQSSDINKPDEKDGNTPLISSIFDQKYGEAYFLIEKGADVKIKNKAGVTALMFAAARNAESIVSILIKKGADINAESNSGNTPLSFAVLYGNNPNIVKKLIDNGANINVRDSDGWTPVMLSAIGGKEKNAVTDVLLSKGADINGKDNKGQTALMYMCHYNSDEKIGILKYIIDKGADINTEDNDGWSALMHAAYYGTISMGEILINKGADLNVKSNSGKTAMNIAENRQNSDEKFIRLLDPNNSQNFTKDQVTTNAYVALVENQKKCVDMRPNVSFVYGNYRNGTITECSYGKFPTVEFHFPLGKKLAEYDEKEIYKVVESTAKQIVGFDASSLAKSGACKKDLGGVSCLSNIRFDNSTYMFLAMIIGQSDYLTVKYTKP